MKLYISMDLEGIAGVSFWHDIKKGSSDFKYFKNIVTEQVNNICKSLFERYKSLDKITICDSHSYGENLIYDNLIENVELIKGFPRKYYMMEGLDEGYAGIIYLGYHVGIGKVGNLDHTYSSSKIYEIKINGKEMNEFYINSFLASEYEIPIISLISGDKLINELKEKHDSIEYIVTKNEIGKFSAKMKNYNNLTKEISERIRLFKDLNLYSTIKPKYPLNVEINLTNTKFAEVASLIPKIKRKGGRNIQFNVKSMKKFYKLLMAVIFISNGVSNVE